VSSLTACAATLGAPLASRDDRLSIVPATLDEQALAAAIEPVDAVALIKIGRHLPKLKRVLRDLGLMHCARYVEHATMASERIGMLEEVPDGGAPYFSMVLVHKRRHAWR
ncbi:MAG: SAM-dependent methyltransferase, partial [Gammaproteobacteria bacterium]